MINKIKITPELAETLLEKNTGNRKIHTKTVKRYSDEMKKGRWLLNGETIKISSTGTILDGQHRLSAVIDSGVSMETFIVTDIDDGSFTSIDIGKKRSAADALYIHGCGKNHMAKASCTRFIFNLMIGKNTEAAVRVSAENSDILNQFLVMGDDFNNDIDAACCLNNAKTLIGYMSLGSFYYLFGKVDKHKRDEFFNGINTGEGLSAGSPILFLRNKILHTRSKGRKMLSEDLINLTIAAWLAFIDGKTVSYLRPRKSYKINDFIEKSKLN